MKKICSILLVLTLVLASCSVAFAAPVVVENADLTSGSKTVEGTVKINITDAQTSSEVYKVDVEWGNLVFEYQFNQQGTWNPVDHKYNDASNAGWKTADKTSEIKVTNHSNKEVKVTTDFATSDTEENGKLTSEKNGVKATLTKLTNETLAAADTSKTTCDCANTTIVLEITGTPNANTTTFDLDKINIIISK